MQSEKSESERLKQKFGAGSAQTKIFDEWDEHTQLCFLSNVQLEDGEHPIFAHCKDNTNWLLMTTRRMVWANHDNRTELRNQNIKSVGWSSGPEDWQGNDPTSPRDTLVFIDGNHDTRGHCKFYSPWLHFIDYSGTRYEVFLERGKVLKTIRNIIWQSSGGWLRSREDVQTADVKDAPLTGSDAYRAQRLKLAFEKYAEHLKKTHVFCAFNSDVQEFLKSQAEMSAEEQPAIAFYEDSSTWYLATSRKMIWASASGVHYIQYQEIVNMGWSEGPKNTLECPHENTMRADGERLCNGCLSKSPWFYLTTSNGARHEIAIETGSSDRIWGCLKLMCRLEKIHR